MRIIKNILTFTKNIKNALRFVNKKYFILYKTFIYNKKLKLITYIYLNQAFIKIL